MSLKIEEVKTGKKNGINIERFTFSDGKNIYRRVDNNTIFPKNASKEHYSLMRGYMARKNNEDEVARIMLERGYGRISRKKHSKKPFVSFCVIALLLVIATVFVVIVINKNHEEKNDDINIVSFVGEKNSGSEIDLQIPSGESKDTTSTKNNTDDKYTSSTSDYNEDRNVYHSHTDSDGTQHYTDGSTFNPHHCDALYEKYNKKKNEAEALHIAWENTFKNQHSYSELYEMAGKNMKLADKMMEEEQAAVDNAMKAYQKALSEENAIYDDEILPCRKEMMQ